MLVYFFNKSIRRSNTVHGDFVAVSAIFLVKEINCSYHLCKNKIVITHSCHTWSVKIKQDLSVSHLLPLPPLSDSEQFSSLLHRVVQQGQKVKYQPAELRGGGLSWKADVLTCCLQEPISDFAQYCHPQAPMPVLSWWYSQKFKNILLLLYYSS